MNLLVKLSTTLRDHVPDYRPTPGLELTDVPEGCTAAELAERLSIPVGEIKIVMINGRQSALDQVLRDGDRVAYFPPVGGG